MSVVVPVYNAAAFLPVSVGSVFEQSMPDWELILVDDGSSDDSLRVCGDFAVSDPRISVLSQTNQGPSAARNTGVSMAKGEFIFFLDADDYLLADSLETLLAVADRENADIVQGNFYKQEAPGELRPQPVVFSPEGIPFEGGVEHLAGNAILGYIRHFLTFPSNHLVSYCWARLYRLSVIRRHGLSADGEMKLFEDFAFNLDFLSSVDTLVFVNKPVYVYVLRGAHMSASMAVFNARQLVADMGKFRRKVDNYLLAANMDEATRIQVRSEVGHTLVHYAIIFVVRACRQLTRTNRPAILKELHGLIRSDVLQSALACYTPRAGNSRLVPWLMRFKFVWLLAVVARWKGNRRYGKLKGVPSS